MACFYISNLHISAFYFHFCKNVFALLVNCTHQAISSHKLFVVFKQAVLSNSANLKNRDLSSSPAKEVKEVSESILIEQLLTLQFSYICGYHFHVIEF